MAIPDEQQPEVACIYIAVVLLEITIERNH